MSSPGRTALYRAYDANGKALYIGITATPLARMDQHRNASPWYPQMARHAVEWFETRRLAMAAERAAVLAEQPPYNKRLKARQAAAPVRRVDASPWLGRVGKAARKQTAALEALGDVIAEARREGVAIGSLAASLPFGRAQAIKLADESDQRRAASEQPAAD